MKLKGKVKVYENNHEEIIPENPKLWENCFIDNILHTYNGKEWIKVKWEVKYDAAMYYCPYIPDMKGGKL
jgi:hypothetical protein